MEILHGHFERIKKLFNPSTFTGLVDDNLQSHTQYICLSFYLFKDEILLCLLVAAFIAEMILQFRKVSAIRGNKPAIEDLYESPMIINGKLMYVILVSAQVLWVLTLDFGLGLDNYNLL